MGWVELGGGGWSWMELVARFSNTPFKVLIGISSLSVQPGIKTRKFISGRTVTRFIGDSTGRNCVYTSLFSEKTLICSLANTVRTG